MPTDVIASDVSATGADVTEIIATAVDAPLTVLLRTSGATTIARGPGLSWRAQDGPEESVGAAEQVLRTVHQLTQSQERITDALVATQDRLAALRALIGVPIDSLEDDSALTEMLAEALELTGSDCAVLAHGDSALIVGDAQVSGRLRQVMTLPSGRPGSGPEPIPLPGGAAVITPVDEPERHAFLGLAREGPPYSTGDLQLIDAVVAATGKLLTLTRMHRHGVQRARIEQEHQLASSLAQAILPTTPPRLEGAQVFATSIPAGIAGGDFITFDVLDGVLWFAVGDVAGKGLPAAIVMTRAVSAARIAFHTHAEDDPAGALDAVDEELFDYLSAVGLFVTMVLGAYRPGSEAVRLCNAGHSPVLSSVDGVITAVPPSTPPLGVIRGLRGRTQTVPLGPGDLLVLGSDGLVEQENAIGGLFGYDRLQGSVAACSALPVADLGERLLADVSDFAAGTAPSDDRTLVLLRAAAS